MRLNLFVGAAVLLVVATAARAGTPTTREQVDELYREVLGREADAGGRATQMKAFARGWTVEQLYESLLFSAEREKKNPLPKEPAPLARALAEELLGRPLEAAAAAAYATDLRTGVRTARELAVLFMGSPEFAKAHPRLFDTIPAPGTEAPTTLYVFDASGTKIGATPREYWDNMQLVATLQGNVNRSGLTLYVIHEPTDQFWLDQLTAKGGFLEKTKIEAIGSDVGALALRFASAIDGLVVYDGKVDATSNVASTVAGAENLVAVRYDDRSGSLYETLSRTFPVKRWLVRPNGDSLFTGSGTIDGTQLRSTGVPKVDAYLWAKVHCLDSGECDPGIFAYTVDQFWVGGKDTEFGHSMLPNHDYFVLHRAFFFDLCPFQDVPATDVKEPAGLDGRTLAELLAAASELAGPRMIHVAGFVPWSLKYSPPHAPSGVDPSLYAGFEQALTALLSSHQAYLDADAPTYTHMANASVYTGVPLEPFYPQPRPTKADLVKRGLLTPSGTVVPRHYVVFYGGDFDSAAWVYSTMPGLWADSARGKVPVAWAIDPNLEERAAPMISWIRKSATANDFFVTGDSGAGYVNPGLLSSAGLETWRDHSRVYTNRWDLSITGFVIDGTAPAMGTDGFRAYLGFTPEGAIGQGMPQESGVLAGLPYASMTNDLPSRPPAGVTWTEEDAIEAGAASINQAAAGSGPLSLQVFRGILRGASYYQGVMERLDRGIEVLDPFTFMLLVRAQAGFEPEDQGAFGADDVPSRMRHGEKRRVYVTVSNTGTSRWEGQGPVRLAATSANQLVFHDKNGGFTHSTTDERAFLALPVCPQGGATFDIELEAPSTGSEAVFQVRLVREGEHFFGPVQTFRIKLD
jgi:hypothetical protein